VLRALTGPDTQGALAAVSGISQGVGLQQWAGQRVFSAIDPADDALCGMLAKMLHMRIVYYFPLMRCACISVFHGVSSY
jgi:hypothetical protein